MNIFTEEEWPAHCDRAAAMQGWGLFDTNGAANHPPIEVQRIDFVEDEGAVQLDDDDDAWEIFLREVGKGSEHGLRALRILVTDSPEELVNICAHRLNLLALRNALTEILNDPEQGDSRWPST